MTAAMEHYDRLLAEHYTWMLGGDIEALATFQTELLGGLGLADPHAPAPAVDLGCGPGQQTLALARLGFTSVAAVDTSATLLDELQDHVLRGAVTAPISPVHGDIRGVLPRITDPGSEAAVVCMGDTLPHLPAHADVQELIADVAASLRPGGSFVATYRDLTRELRGTDRFIPVRSSADRILTCFLDYVSEDKVQVHDLLYARHDGAWALQTSSYPKLRLSPQWMDSQCSAAGLEIRHHDTDARGMRTLHARKP